MSGLHIFCDLAVHYRDHSAAIIYHNFFAGRFSAITSEKVYVKRRERKTGTWWYRTFTDSTMLNVSFNFFVSFISEIIVYFIFRKEAVVDRAAK